MGTPLAPQTVSGYNASPPADDGSVTAANKVTWAKIKTQLGDPLNSFDSAINTALRTALNVTPTTQSTAYTTTTADHLRPIEVTGTTTISLGDAATMVAAGMGYQAIIINRGTALVTVALITAANTLDGTANGTVTLAPGNGAIFTVNSTSNGYETIARAKPYIHGADIASAATVNLDAATGDYVHITGTTTVTAITLQDGDQKTVEFTGALTLTNGGSLILPGGANITTAAGDTAIFRGEASGVVRCITYTKASGKPVINTANTEPTSQVFTSGSGTYTTPAGVTRIHVRMVGGGGGGGGSGTTGGNGGAGGNTTFSTATASGGGAGGGSGGGGGAGGAASGGTINIAGGSGQGFVPLTNSRGGNGGNSVFGGGGGGGGGNTGVTPGNAGATNSGGGGGAAGTVGTGSTGSGGGSGGYVEWYINSPAASYAYAVGGAGTAGSAGTGGDLGGAGGSGIIIVHEFYD